MPTGRCDRNTTFAASDIRSVIPRSAPGNMAGNLTADLVRDAARAKGTTPDRQALVRVPAQKPFIVPIPDTRIMERPRA